MRLWICEILFFIVSLVSCAYYEDRYHELLAEFRSNEDMTWELGKNRYFEHMTETEIRGLVGALPENPSKFLKTIKRVDSDIVLPEEYDVRKEYPNCKHIPFIKDQSACGSCWAVASASVMSDRVCIASGGSQQPFLSEDELISCCRTCGKKCNGGYASNAFRYWQTNGIPSGGPYGAKDGCKPYSVMPCKYNCPRPPYFACKNYCIKEYTVPIDQDRTYGKELQTFSGELEIMKELLRGGPVVSSIEIYEDFYYYKSGIYQHVKGRPEGNHAIRVIGWGVEDGVKYWLCANSWNTTFGEQGYFRILRGKNHCGIEKLAFASDPLLKK